MTSGMLKRDFNSTNYQLTTDLPLSWENQCTKENKRTDRNCPLQEGKEDHPSESE